MTIVFFGSIRLCPHLFHQSYARVWTGRPHALSKQIITTLWSLLLSCQYPHYTGRANVAMLICPTSLTQQGKGKCFIIALLLTILYFLQSNHNFLDVNQRLLSIQNSPMIPWRVYAFIFKALHDVSPAHLPPDLTFITHFTSPPTTPLSLHSVPGADIFAIYEPF